LPYQIGGCSAINGLSAGQQQQRQQKQKQQQQHETTNTKCQTKTCFYSSIHRRFNSLSDLMMNDNLIIKLRLSI